MFVTPMVILGNAFPGVGGLKNRENMTSKVQVFKSDTTFN